MRAAVALGVVSVEGAETVALDLSAAVWGQGRVDEEIGFDGSKTALLELIRELIEKELFFPAQQYPNHTFAPGALTPFAEQVPRPLRRYTENSQTAHLILGKLRRLRAPATNTNSSTLSVSCKSAPAGQILFAPRAAPATGIPDASHNRFARAQ